MFWYEHALRIQWRSYSGWSVNILNLCLLYKITRKCYLASPTSIRFLKPGKTYREIRLLKNIRWFSLSFFFFFLLLARNCLLALYILVYIKGVKCYTYKSSTALGFCFQVHGKISFLHAVVHPSPCLSAVLSGFTLCLPHSERETSLTLPIFWSFI